jgi:hypothetical protein
MGISSFWPLRFQIVAAGRMRQKSRIFQLLRDRSVELRSVCACINFLRAKIRTAGFKQTDWGYSSSPILSFRLSGDVPLRIGDWPAGYRLSALAPAQRAVAQRLSAMAHCGGSWQCSSAPAMGAKRTVGGDRAGAATPDPSGRSSDLVPRSRTAMPPMWYLGRNLRGPETSGRTT